MKLRGFGGYALGWDLSKKYKNMLEQKFAAKDALTIIT